MRSSTWNTTSSRTGPTTCGCTRPAAGKSNFLLFGEYFSYDDNTQASYCKDVGYSFNSTLWFPMQLTMKNVFAYEQGTTQLVTA
jgi:hypothetical protein